MTTLLDVMEEVRRYHHSYQPRQPTQLLEFSTFAMLRFFNRHLNVIQARPRSNDVCTLAIAARQPLERAAPIVQLAPEMIGPEP